MIPNILSIAGSDPSGGAGVQADIKAISANGGYAMAAITALTAQNTRGVFGVQMIPPDFVAAQIAAIRADIRVPHGGGQGLAARAGGPQGGRQPRCRRSALRGWSWQKSPLTARSRSPR